MKFWDKIRPTRRMLVKLKMKARRFRVWFNELSRNQRSIIDLVIVVVDEKVRSLALAKLLAPIVKKLLEAMGGIQALIGEIAYKTKTVGVSLAKKLSRIAQTWGNESASEWPEDKSFIRYLAVIDKYQPSYV